VLVGDGGGHLRCSQNGDGKRKEEKEENQNPVFL